MSSDVWYIKVSIGASSSEAAFNTKAGIESGTQRLV